MEAKYKIKWVLFKCKVIRFVKTILFIKQPKVRKFKLENGTYAYCIEGVRLKCSFDEFFKNYESGLSNAE